MQMEKFIFPSIHPTLQILLKMFSGKRKTAEIMKMKLREKIYQDVTNRGVPETLPPFQSIINPAKK